MEGGLTDIIQYYLYVKRALRQFYPTVAAAYRTYIQPGGVTSLNIYLSITYAGYLVILKVYGKRVGRSLVPVLGISHRLMSTDGPLYYPALDIDGDATPPRWMAKRAIVYWEYVKDGKRRYHIVLTPTRSRSKALSLMKRYDDNKHLKRASVDWLGWGVLRVSGWEPVVYYKFDENDVMGLLHKKLRTMFWL